MTSTSGRVSDPTRGRRRRAIGCFTALVASSALVVATTGPSVTAAPTIPLQLLAFNDYHGHVTDETAGTIGTEAAGGGEYLSAELNLLRSTAAGDSLTVAAGDLIGGSPYFSGLFHDEPSVESLNAMGLDVSSVGNHEFDEGVTELLRMQNGGCHPDDGCYFPATPYAGADFQWLAANVVETATDTPVLPPYEIKTVGTQQVAFIGMTLEGTPSLVAASGLVGYTFKDEVATANALVPEIQALGIEAIVVLVHEGGIPTPFAINGCQGISGPIVAINEGLDPAIDVVISGHTHEPYTCMLPDPDGVLRSVTSAYSFGRVVTEINMNIDDVTGDVDRTSVTAVNHPVIQSALTPDPAVTAVVDKWSPLADAKGLDPVGEVTATITRAGDPTGSSRGLESAAVNLVADAQLYATQGLGAQIALMNPGGVRSDLTYPQSGTEGDGVVTYGEAFTFQPFNNTLYTFDMTGAQIVSVLEEQCAPGGSSRPVLHLGVSEGFTYDLDITLQDGVCTDIEISNVQLDGVALDPLTTYRVTANGFLADGGDDFDTFATLASTLDPTLRQDGGQDLDALLLYLAEQSPLSPPSIDRVNEIGTTLPGLVKAVLPARLLETRTGPDEKTVDGLFQGAGPLGAGQEIQLQVTGRGGVPMGASAVELNIGAVLPKADGFITAYPCDAPGGRPQASNVNYFAGDIVSNAAVVKLSADGKVCLYTLSQTDIIVDVNGLVPADGSPESVVPARLLETRNVAGFNTTDGKFKAVGRLGAGKEIQLDVRNRAGVSADADAVIMNVGAVMPTANGFLSVYPCGATLPTASSVNYFAGEVRSNTVLSKVGANGKVCIYTLSETDVIADVTAFVPAGGTPYSVVPARLLETRKGPGETTIDGQFQGVGKVAAGSTTELLVAGRGGLSATVGTVVVNVAAVFPTAPGFLTVFECGKTPAQASNVNYFPGEVVPNFVLAKVSALGKICIYSLSETDVIVDVVGGVDAPVPFRT